MKIQHELNCDVLEKVQAGITKLDRPNNVKTLSHLRKASKLLEVRNTALQVADASKHGWETWAVIEEQGLATNDKHQRILRRAERVAKEHVEAKSTKKRSERKSSSRPQRFASHQDGQGTSDRRYKNYGSGKSRGSAQKTTYASTSF